MPRKREKKEKHGGEYACDFETYVAEDTTEQTETYVWSAAFVELTEAAPVSICENFPKMLDRITAKWKAGDTVKLFFHNLKFDGSFILADLLASGFQFIKTNKEGKFGKTYLDRSKMHGDEFNCIVSDTGQFYECSFKWNGVNIIIRDSYKLIPMSLKKAGHDFKTEHQKTEMAYKGNKTIYNISAKDRDYIMNDVLVLKELLLKMFDDGHTAMTIGACCMSEYHKQYKAEEWARMFPDLTRVNIPELGNVTQYEYIKKSYRGGWCYVNSDIQGKTLKRGAVYDANSHYPSQMDNALNFYPIGVGRYHKAINNQFDERTTKEMGKPFRFWFIRFKCSFNIKPGFFPFVQIKGSPLYNGREMLRDSRITMKGKKWEGKKFKKIRIGLEEWDDRPELCMTCNDWKLFRESYDVEDLEIFDALIFDADTGASLFHNYIDKYRIQKIEAGKIGNGAAKAIAKLFLNNLYGKFSTDPNSSYKIPKLDSEGVLHFDTVIANDKKPGYIAIGSAVTSYARCVTVRLADSNYNHFAYADTDSVHLYNLPKGFEIQGIPVDDLAFGAWKKESEWSTAKFLRAKTYIENIKTEKGGYSWEVKGAGMTPEAKADIKKMLKAEGVDVFKIGLEIGTNLKPVQIKGGTLLRETTFRIK